MKKYIKIVIILIYFVAFKTTLNGTIWRVPEQTPNGKIQEGIGLVSNGDTVSVNFGRVNGQRSTVSTSRISGKEITFEVRGEGKEQLLDLLKNKSNQQTRDIGNQKIPRWTEQEMINRPDSLSDIAVNLTMDSLGLPWAVWLGPESIVGRWNYDTHYSKWNGIDWDEEMRVTPWDNLSRSKPRLTFDNQNTPWIILARTANPGHECDIFYTRWNGTYWGPENQINLPDSTELDFSPRIDCNGGQMWCVWYGGRTDTSQYHIYVSKWNGTSWNPETDVSFPISSNQYGLHWFCDIAVDRAGHPHVVWGETWFTGRIYYRTYNGQVWLPPVILNNPDSIRCAGWPDLSIAIDNQDNINVVWVGLRPNGTPGSNQEVYYSKFDRVIGNWRSPVQINTPDDVNDNCPYVASKSSNNIWIAWDKEISFWGAHILVTHFDGINWNEEERLDNDSISYCNLGPNIDLDRNTKPWIAWDGFTLGVGQVDVYYKRYLDSGIEESQNFIKLGSSNVRLVSVITSKNVEIFYEVTTPVKICISIYDVNGRLIRNLRNEEQKSGIYKAMWNRRDLQNRQVSKGVYFLNLKNGGKNQNKKIILI